jgi:transposase
MEDNVAVKRTRRRLYSAEFKAQAVNACMQPGISVAAIALHYRLNANLLRRWIVAQRELDAAVQARRTITVSPAEFVPLQLPAPVSVSAPQDILIELRRGAALVTVRWPGSAAADCASWLQGWLRGSASTQFGWPLYPWTCAPAPTPR